MNNLASLFFENLTYKIVAFTTINLTAQTWDFNSIESPFNRIYYIKKGYGFASPDCPSPKTTRLEPGKIYLLPKNTRYRLKCPDTMTQQFIHFNLDFMNSFDVFQQFTNPLVIDATPEDISFFENEALAINYFEYASNNFNTTDFGGINESENVENAAFLFKCYSYIAGIIARFMEQYPIDLSEQLIGRYKYANVFQALNHHMSIQADIDELADELSVSKSFLLKNFKRDIGCTVKQYNSDIVMQKAKEMLYASSATIKEISYQLGFQDEFYFSKLFKKKFSISPKQYRNSIGARQS